MSIATNKKTVFVLGAGASKELRLPTGDELKTSIAKDLDIRFEHFSSKVSGSDEITEAFRVLAKAEPAQRDINSYLHASWRIRDAMPQAISIDNFLDAHSDDPLMETCGKLAIASSILKAESKSKLAVNSRSGESKPQFSSFADTWHNSFFQLLTENCKKADLASRLQKVALIVFNYDRCIEVYLIQALKNYYALPEADAVALLKLVEIYHPYGVVGGLPNLGTGTIIGFGETPRPHDLINIAKEIKTFTEGTDKSSSDFKRIRELMQKAQRIVFLGFAYHRLNLQLLFKNPSGLHPLETRKIFGTALGLSSSDCEIIKEELSQYAESDAKGINIRNDLTCAQLFKEYWRSMSLN